MLLAIDCGNTNTVFAVFDGEDCRAQWRASTNPERTADEYAVWLNQLMGLKDLTATDIDASIVATVVPQALFSLRTLSREYFGCEALVVGDNGAELGIEIRIDRPMDVGADRLVNAVAAHASYPGPMIVIDFGTATTFDIVDTDGAYLGGVIAPGVNLSLEALHMAAAKLPRIAVDRPDHVIGRGTIPAMQSGVYWGYMSLIEGLVSRIKDEFGKPMTVVATGGLAPLFAKGTEIIEFIDDDLTIRGLLEIYRRNQG
jgi:type III pantothenate kinase